MCKSFFIFLLSLVFIWGCKKEVEYEAPEEVVRYVEEEEEYEFPVLDVDGSFEGVLTTDGDYTIKGRFKGSLIATGTVFIDETGIVECDSIVASDVIVKGHVTGPIKALYEIRVDTTGVVVGETFCKNLVVNGGSIFHGESKMAEPKKRRRRR